MPDMSLTHDISHLCSDMGDSWDYVVYICDWPSILPEVCLLDSLKYQINSKSMKPELYM